MSFNFLNPMPSPDDIKNELPLSAKGKALKAKRDKEIGDIITGKDNRFLVIVGPCSADNEDAGKA